MIDLQSMLDLFGSLYLTLLACALASPLVMIVGR